MEILCGIDLLVSVIDFSATSVVPNVSSTDSRESTSLLALLIRVINKWGAIQGLHTAEVFQGI